MTTTREVSIFIAEDHVISRMGLRMLLEQNDAFKVIGEADDGEESIKEIERLRPAVVMMDLSMPKVDGIEATRIIKERLPETRVLIFTTADDDQSIFASLKAGADGYCLKNISADLLATAINSVLRGAAWLDPSIAQKVIKAQTNAMQDSGQIKKEEPVTNVSDSKMKLLSMLEQGKSSEEMSKELGLAETIVKGHLRELMGQLQGAATQVTKAPHGNKLAEGDMIGEHYKIVETLGFGGMGMIYKAKHEHIERTVAIKTIHEHLANDPATIERFKLEAESNSSIVHPNLISIYDFGLAGGTIPYMVMEFIDGVTLSDLIDQSGNLEVDATTHVFKQICQCLDAVHNAGVVHRDLKPSNIMLIDKDGDMNFVKLLDFGIAKVMRAAQSGSAITSTGEIVGSPPYMSPEYFKDGNVDYRSDLYSLGCLIYEAYTGRPPFMAESPMEVLMKHINAMAPREPLANAQVPEPIQNILFSLLEKEPDDRPSTAGEVLAKLESVTN